MPQHFLEDQTSSLVTAIQGLVSSIRTVDDPPVLHDRIQPIASIIAQVVKETQRAMDAAAAPLLRERAGPIVRNLAGCRARLLEREDDGRDIVGHEDWKAFLGTLPPIGFEIAREIKELMRRVEGVAGGGDDDDFR
jgi:hypothetical protein